MVLISDRHRSMFTANYNEKGHRRPESVFPQDNHPQKTQILHIQKKEILPSLWKEKEQEDLLVMNASSQRSRFDHEGATSRNGISMPEHTLQ